MQSDALGKNWRIKLSNVDNEELQEKRIRLINGIAQATSDGRITWDDTSEKDIFVAQFVDVSIQVIDANIRKDYTAHNAGSFTISFFDKRGRIIDSFSLALESPFESTSKINLVVFGLRLCIKKSLENLTSKRLDSILEKIGA